MIDPVIFLLLLAAIYVAPHLSQIVSVLLGLLFLALAVLMVVAA